MVTIQIRRGTAAAIGTADPTLAAGEPCVETDTGKIKVGDGATAWASLGYIEAAIKLDDLATPDDNTDLDATTSAHGLLKKLDNNTEHFMRGDGTWATPSGAGDVSGPETSTDGNIPRWSGTGGDTLVDGVEFSTDGTLADDSDTAIPSEKAVKTYVDGHNIDGGTIT